MNRTRSRWGILALLAACLSAGGCAVHRGRPPRPEPGLGLWVRIGPEGADILRARRIPRSRPANPPLLAGDQPIAGVAELVVAWYDENGKPMTSFGFPARSLSMAAPHTSTTGAAKTRRIVTHERYLEFPVPHRAAFLALAVVSSSVPSASKVALSICDLIPSCFVCRRVWPGEIVVIPESVRVYGVGAAGVPTGPGSFLGKNRPSALLDGIVGIERMRLDRDCLIVPPSTIPPTPPPGTLGDTCPYDDGVIGTPEALAAGSRADAERFVVVITGDGFTAAEEGDLRDYARKVADELLATAPFDEFADRTDIWLVPAESPERGIPFCSDDVDRSTVFEVRGRWIDDDGSPGPDGFLGTDALCRVEEAVERAAAWSDVDAVVVLGNCEVYGGRAVFDNKTAFLPLGAENTGYPLERTAIHELGHVLARLGEEYTNCATPDATRTFPLWFPNVAPASEEKTVWWLSLLGRGERDSSGGFLAAHRCQDPFEADGCTPKLTGRANPDMLGWYWGAMYGDAAGTKYGTVDDCRGNCSWGTLLPSCDYFRPANDCTMFRSSAPFCRACAEKIREFLVTTTAP